MLRSRCVVPVGLNQCDNNRLGVATRQTVLQWPGVLTTFDPDNTLFVTAGCYRPEGGHCWTDGELTLPPALFAHLGGAFSLVVHTKPHCMRYPVPDRIEVVNPQGPTIALAV